MVLPEDFLQILPLSFRLSLRLVLGLALLWRMSVAAPLFPDRASLCPGLKKGKVLFVLTFQESSHHYHEVCNHVQTFARNERVPLASDTGDFCGFCYEQKICRQSPLNHNAVILTALSLTRSLICKRGDRILLFQ